MPSKTNKVTAPIVFLVNGLALPQEQRATRGASATKGKLRGVQIASANRAGGSEHRLEAVPGSDTVLLTISNGRGSELRLNLHPEHARALMLASMGSNGEGDDVVQVPNNLQWKGIDNAVGTQRGVVGDVVIKSLELLGIDPRDALAKLAAAELGKLLDAQVNEGVYALSTTAFGSLKSDTPVRISSSDTPILVLIHGTFVDTKSTFGDWWNLHPSLIAQLFTHYSGRVYALDHGTVMRSPIANALTLASSLPHGAKLHLVTHSRGGLVAEVLLRASLGVTDEDLQLFIPDENSKDVYAQHRQDLQALGAMLVQKQIKVERIVRVACPAYGTLLASNRLDAYLSVLAWLMERVGVPVLPALIHFADAVARERANPASMPGIEAMRSDSAVIRWLNLVSASGAESELRVVAGDITGDSLISWVKTLLADSFYRTDNDIVVQTSSMYGGMGRAKEASFLLDRSGKTDHFSYFSNERTANAIAQALMLKAPTDFARIGPLSRLGQDASGTRGAGNPAILKTGQFGDSKRPIVFVLPGIVGSNLKRDDQREWLVWWRLFGMVNRIAIDKKNISEDGPVDSYYGDLMDALCASHEVRPFGYDWRVSLSVSAGLLAEQVKLALDHRDTGQPVRVLAHSMGCMVLRVMQIEHPTVWDDMMARDGAQVLMLGPPNGGSWAPMSIYTGDDDFGRFLSNVGGAFHEYAARKKMVRFIGLLQLQADLTNPATQLGDAQYWEKMAADDLKAARSQRAWHDDESQVAAYEWALPSQQDLDNAVKLRRQFDMQLPALLAHADKIKIVLGQSAATPCGLVWDEQGMHYQSTAQGDGRVTWESACLPGVATWKTAQVHGDLPKAKQNFAAYIELLETGKTKQFEPYTGVQRGDGSTNLADPRKCRVMPRRRDIAMRDVAIPIDASSLMAAAMGSVSELPQLFAERTPVQILSVEVLNGDLRFIPQPLLLGHSRAMTLTGSEYVVNGLMGNVLQESLGIGLYPTQIGQHQIFENRHANPDNPFGLPRPQAAIIVGLGDEGDLKPESLVYAVRQAVLAYQQQANCIDMDRPGLSLASTTLGSGGNLSVGQSATALVQGVLDANAKIAMTTTAIVWPSVTHLLIVEQFHNRALEAWHTLHAAIEAGTLTAYLQPQVRPIYGMRSRPLGGHYRATSYDLIRITQKSSAENPGQVELEFSLNTKRARSELRGKGTQVHLVNALIAAAESNTRFDVDLARSLFQLLLPHELKEYLGSASTLIFEVDSDTAAYPWEMLDDCDVTNRTHCEPWALRMSGALLRKMRIDQFRREPSDALTDRVLVIGAPKLGGEMPDLPAARAEACRVAELFGSNASLLLDGTCLDNIKTAIPHSWKIIHMAGHGHYDENGEKSGMLMSDETVFGPSEFESMINVPELVFVNCCHLGKTENNSRRTHSLFAANVAEQLIRNGVRCVVAAGWAVDDDVAQVFALAFYQSLLRGDDFATAVNAARSAAFAQNGESNTWAAYQCYGDPGWRLQRFEKALDAKIQTSTFPLIASQDELLLTLEALRSDAQSANPEERQQLRYRLIQLEEVASAIWKACGNVAEAYGQAWCALGDKLKGLAYFNNAVNAEDGSASLVAREQQLNLKVRTTTSVDVLNSSITQIEALILLAPTAERYSILGSTYKRIVMHKDVEKDVAANLGKMRDAYKNAEAHKPLNLYYPLAQRCMAQLRLHWLGIDQDTKLTLSFVEVANLKLLLAQQQQRAPDFWCAVGQHEASLLDALIHQELALHINAIVLGMQDVHSRVSNKTYWSSVFDTAQFLLPAYIVNASESEKDAADIYLNLVKSFI